MNVRAWVVIFSVALTPAMLPSMASAAPQSKSELKEQFEQRFPAIERLKNQGRVGETFGGFLEAVEGKELDDKAKDLIEQENRDRKKLYDLIANDVKNQERKISAEKVAERNARRNLSNAKPNEFLKTKDGVWVQRQDVEDLKREGKVGETWEGYVEGVKGEDLDKTQRAAIEVENIARKEQYEREARKSKTDLENVAQREGKRNIDNARKGEFTLQRDGDWERKK